jgi:hypothetical protein
MPTGFFYVLQGVPLSETVPRVIGPASISREQISGLGIDSVLLISPKFWPVERERKQDGSSAPRLGPFSFRSGLSRFGRLPRHGS